ncbi:MAG: hypothetical protein AAGJ81_15915 [Verrucomicrobiota bacterium]
MVSFGEQKEDPRKLPAVAAASRLRWIAGIGRAEGWDADLGESLRAGPLAFAGTFGLSGCALVAFSGDQWDDGVGPQISRIGAD